MDNGELAELHQASVLVSLRRFQAAREKLRPLVAAYPDSQEIMLLIAVTHIGLGEYAAAEEVLRAALAEDPDSERGRELLAQVLEEQKKFVEAEEILIGLIRSSPEKPSYLADYALLMLFTLHVEKAHGLAREAARLGPDDDDALFALHLTEMVRGDAPAAEQVMKRLLESHPERYRTLHALAFTLVSDGRYRQALPILQELLRWNPNDRDLIDWLIDVKIYTSPLALPIYPLIRWEGYAAAITWCAGIAGIFGSYYLFGNSSAVLWTAGIYAFYVLYSWVCPPLLRAWFRKRGF